MDRLRKLIRWVKLQHHGEPYFRLMACGIIYFPQNYMTNARKEKGVISHSAAPTILPWGKK